jgi:transposase
MACLRGKRNLTTEKKARIVGMVDPGMSHAKVGKAVGLGRTTITEIVKRSKACGTVKTAKKSGRPRLNTDRDLRQLRQVLQDNQKSTLAKVTDSLSVAVSTSTVRRRAHEMGFNNRVAVKKPFANNINQQKDLLLHASTSIGRLLTGARSSGRTSLPLRLESSQSKSRCGVKKKTE